MDCHLVPVFTINEHGFTEELMFFISPAAIMTSYYLFLRVCWVLVNFILILKNVLLDTVVLTGIGLLL
jgi:hypothetical protein